MRKFEIPGYEDALREERRLREEIFLDVPAVIGGVVVNHITPSLLARLAQMRTPFICGGEYNEAETLRFMFAVWSEFVPQSHPEFNDKILMLTALLRQRFPDNFLALEDEIDQFISVTFMDGPRGGPESVPYVTGIAWHVYQMAKEPYGWDEQRTLDTPLRKIYQYLRCLKLERGDIMFNELSDTVKANWLQELRENKITGNS